MQCVISNTLLFQYGKLFYIGFFVPREPSGQLDMELTLQWMGSNGILDNKDKYDQESCHKIQDELSSRIYRFFPYWNNKVFVNIRFTVKIFMVL